MTSCRLLQSPDEYKRTEATQGKEMSKTRENREVQVGRPVSSHKKLHRTAGARLKLRPTSNYGATVVASPFRRLSNRLVPINILLSNIYGLCIMTKKSVEKDKIIQRASRVASLLSLFTIITCTSLYFCMAYHIETVVQDLNAHINSLQKIRKSAEDDLESVEHEHFRFPRQTFSQRNRNRWSNYEERGRSSGRRRNNGDAPKICDCMVIQCPRGEPGKPGTDGIYQVDEPDCPACPRGPPGDDGAPGEQGEPGKPGIPGEPGKDGTNEPGVIGDPGSRGQPGRAGLKGEHGEPGQDFVQLVGLPGPKGSIGLPGLAGLRGDPGENGDPAPPGPEGYPGPVGEVGEQGDDGLRGPSGKKGPPGKDGGYCQCPPREGTGFVSSRQSSSSLDDRGEEDREEEPPKPQRQRQRPQKIRRPNEESEYDDIFTPSSRSRGNAGRQPESYARPPRPRNSDLIDVGSPTMRHSPMAPLIAYKDSSEAVTNRVIMQRVKSRDPLRVKGSTVDFELR
ncbi:unnamed protein product [Caenorhabditis auriculariae]|uniref:Nematode cuticle collagen N-terminal domain-containing protein n=1 Tax=Caenorhabditis auriculariae TaxID=2777116 RepID=A0A8S1HFM8_9PELO|nr:unnamed protein product [Caenorhabditis auriculariae]